MTPVSRTIGTDRVVDEMVFKFTHTIPMDWMLPGVPPTGRRVEIPLVVIVRFRDGNSPTSTSTGIRPRCWCRSARSTPSRLPVAGVETARKVLDPGLPSNELMTRASR